MARAWYSYNNVGNPQLPNSYFYSSARPTCINGFTPCAIYAVDGNPNPATLSLNIQNYIAAGLSTGLAQPIGPVKKYVYMKPQGQ